MFSCFAVFKISDFFDFRDIGFENPFDPFFKGNHGVRTAGAVAAHFDIDNSIREVFENDVASVLFDSRADARINQPDDAVDDVCSGVSMTASSPRAA